LFKDIHLAVIIDYLGHTFSLLLALFVIRWPCYLIPLPWRCNFNIHIVAFILNWRNSINTFLFTILDEFFKHHFTSKWNLYTTYWKKF